MSPILVRPVREQLEHDRIIRLLQTKNRRKFEVGINPGAAQNVPHGTGPTAVYPDLVLAAQGRSRRVEAIVEVETGESVNHLEALAQWSHFARLRAAFHLYVPSTMIEVARRLCDDNQIVVNEIWSYHGIGDDIRFTLVHRVRDLAPPPRRVSVAPDAPSGRASKPAVAARPAKAAKPAKPAPVKAAPVKAALPKAAKAAKPAAAKAVKPAPVRKAAKKPAKAQKHK